MVANPVSQQDAIKILSEIELVEIALGECKNLAKTASKGKIIYVEMLRQQMNLVLRETNRLLKQVNDLEK